jgi:hypothetical protein
MSEPGMFEKKLDGAQLGAGFQHVCCEPLPQGVRRQWRRPGFLSWEATESNQRIAANLFIAQVLANYSL